MADLFLVRLISVTYPMIMLLLVKLYRKVVWIMNGCLIIFCVRLRKFRLVVRVRMLRLDFRLVVNAVVLTRSDRRPRIGTPLCLMSLLITPTRLSLIGRLSIRRIAGLKARVHRRLLFMIAGLRMKRVNLRGRPMMVRPSCLKVDTWYIRRSVLSVTARLMRAR